MGMVVGDVVLVSFRGVTFGQRIISTLTYRVLTPTTIGQGVLDDLDDLLTAIRATGPSNLVTRYLALACGQYGLEELRAQRIAPDRSAYRFVIEGGVGTRADAVAANTNGVWTAQTSEGVRGGIANRYTPPIAADDSLAGYLSDDYQDALGFWADLVIQQLNLANGMQLKAAIYHKGAVAPAAIYTDVVGAAVQNTTRVKTRRTVGRGE